MDSSSDCLFSPISISFYSIVCEISSILYVNVSMNYLFLLL